MIKHFKYKIIEVELLPFGGITKIEKDLNSSLNKEIIISISGIIMQLGLFIVLSFLRQYQLISYNIYNLYNKYNFSILIFNLLPIIPLDGSIFVKSLLEKYISFYNSQIINIIISLVFLIIFIYFNYYFSLNNYLIAVFLFYKIYEYLKNLKYIYNRFLLERYLKEYNYRKIKVIKKLKQIQKEKKNYFQINNSIIKERDVLKKYFNSY